MINLHFVEAVQAPTDGLPQLWRSRSSPVHFVFSVRSDVHPSSAVQTLALLSSHLAGLNFLFGAWNLARLASQDVLDRQLNDPSKCGQGSDAQVRRRAFWSVRRDAR